MGIAEEYLKLMRQDEISAEEARIKAINEAAEENQRAIHESILANEFPMKVSEYRLKLSKAIITEAVTRLYMKSLLVENAEKYADTLMPIARKEIVSTMSDIKSMDELCERVSHMSPYIKQLLPLCEEVCNDDKKVEAAAKEYDTKVLLDKDDLSLIQKFENEKSADVYAGAIQDRVIDVYKAEEEANKEQKIKVQAVVDIMSDSGETVQESVQSGIHVFDAEPKTIFNAIFVNKSKAIMQESAGSSVEDHAEDILCETICTYTLLECIHSLGLKTYSDDEKIRLRYEFITA